MTRFKFSSHILESLSGQDKILDYKNWLSDAFQIYSSSYIHSVFTPWHIVCNIKCPKYPRWSIVIYQFLGSSYILFWLYCFNFSVKLLRTEIKQSQCCNKNYWKFNDSISSFKKSGKFKTNMSYYYSSTVLQKNK